MKISSPMSCDGRGSVAKLQKKRDASNRLRKEGENPNFINESGTSVEPNMVRQQLNETKMELYRDFQMMRQLHKRIELLNATLDK